MFGIHYRLESCVSQSCSIFSLLLLEKLQLMRNIVLDHNLLFVQSQNESSMSYGAYLSNCLPMGRQSAKNFPLMDSFGNFSVAKQMEVCAPCSTDFPNKFSKIPMVIRSLVAKPSKIDVRTSPVNEKIRVFLVLCSCRKPQWC